MVTVTVVTAWRWMAKVDHTHQSGLDRVAARLRPQSIGQYITRKREKIAALIGQGKDVKIIAIGRKARDQLRRLYGDRFVANLEAGANPSLERAQEVASLIAERFEAGDADVVTLFFSRFRSVVSQVPTARQLIPAQVEGGGKIDLKGACYEYEPDEETILATLLPVP